ncbi:MAG: hypothetical protein GY929_27320 [Actinomycetia bacterium]|nr:hypothetical protein [Actinomycetes bacterium]
MGESERIVWRRGDPPWAPPELWSLAKVFGVTMLLIPASLIALGFSTIVRTGCTGPLGGDAPVDLTVGSAPPSAGTGDAGWCLDGATSWWTPGLAVVGAILVGGWLPAWIVRSGIAASTTVGARLGLFGLGAVTGAVGVVSLAWLLLGSADRVMPG